MRQITMPWRRHRDPHAQIHLPPLSGDEALLIANLLDRAIAALWRTHGQAMTERLTCLDPHTSPQTTPEDRHLATTADPRPAADDIF